jgi:FSR family fosmidomycin resistance protein-like MFS transporter
MERRERRFAIVISGAHGMDHFLKRTFPPLLPVWAVGFGFPLWKLGFLLGSLTFGSAIGQAPMGHLSDRYDRRLMLPAGITLMSIGFILFPVLSNAAILGFEVTVAGVPLTGHLIGMLAVMLVIGIGSSTLHPTGYPLISQNVSDQRQGTVLGMWGSARSLGEGIAPALVGVGLLLTGWEWILVAFGGIGLVYAVYLFVTLGAFETRPPDRVAAESGEPIERASVWDRDRRVYVYPVLLIFAAFTLQLVSTAGVTVFLPEFITSEYGYAFSIGGFSVTAESTASFYYSALLLTAGGVQIGTGRLVDQYDHRKVLLGFLAVGAGALAVLAEFVLSPLVLFPVLLVLGGSLWGLNPARDAIVSDIAPAAHEGRTFGYLWTGGLVLSSAAPAVVGRIGDTAGLRFAFLLVAGLVVASAIPIVGLLSNRVYVDSRNVDHSEID